jgi:hypothetical protein
MPGSTLQLQAIGIQDTYILSKDITSNLFEYGYRQYVNFATEIVRIPIKDNMNWGKRTSSIIPRSGNLLSNLYLKVTLPKLTLIDGSYVGYSDTLGYAIFTHLHLEIGGVIVERLEPHYMDIIDELTHNKSRGKDEMILKSDTFIATQHNADIEKTLFIPLPFFFTKQYNVSLPLVSLTNPDIKIHFGFKEFDECIHYDGNTQPIKVDITSVELWGEYIYLDDSIIRDFEKREHRYIIESVQYNGMESIPPSISTHNTHLDFNHLVRELLFVLVDKNAIDNNDHFNYNRYNDSESLLREANMYIENMARFENNLPEMYLRSVFPYKQHSVVPYKRIYTIPFALNCELNQPTGAINFSRFTNVMLSLVLNNNNTEVFLHVFAIYHNFMTIMNGCLYMEFEV